MNAQGPWTTGRSRRPATGPRLVGAGGTQLLRCVLLVAVVVGGAEAALGGPATAPEQTPALTPLAEVQEQATRRALVGDWTATVGPEEVELALAEEGRFRLRGRTGTYLVKAGTLLLRSAEGESAYPFKLSEDQLTLTGGDLAGPVVFQRRLGVGGYAAWLLNFSPESAARKLLRIGTILGIVLIAWLAIRLLKALSRFVILSDSGPLARLYRTHKSRALTIHSLVLNVVKYVAYLAALGFVLSELGVNYKAYLASLSVIGLAIGFGSQDLVRDMVTGFFIIFEGQYDVGDMVEISRQTGVVQEIGLRMTRLRNYHGQVVVIPNRNISMVGNFSRGAQRAHVDVAVEPAVTAQAGEVLRTVAGEVARQFNGVILARPAAPKPLSLATGECFLRLELSIWPNQEWVVEKELAPRVREAFGREKLAIPGDRITVFYIARKRREVRPRVPGLSGLAELAGRRARRLFSRDKSDDAGAPGSRDE